MKEFKDMKDFVDYITKSENLEELYAEVVKNGEKEENYDFANHMLNKQVYFNLQLLNFYKHKYGKVSLKELVEYTKNKE